LKEGDFNASIEREEGRLSTDGEKKEKGVGSQKTAK